MSVREMIFLGTSSQVPTRARGHNSMFLRWDDLGILFDPGEGTQRQMAHAGIAAHQITHIAITHFHGDHCLGLAALVQRISLDRVPHPIEVIYPASGQVYFERLRNASIFHDMARIVPKPFSKANSQVVTRFDQAVLMAYPLDHRVDCYGYRLQEFDGRRMLPEKLTQAGIVREQIGQLIREGKILKEGVTYTLEEMSVHRKGQSFALVMDTRPCPGAMELSKGVDLLVSESTYLESEAQEAHNHYHMTAAQAAKMARQAGARRLALTHFSQRYLSLDPFFKEARAYVDDVVVAQDFTKVSVPPREDV